MIAFVKTVPKQLLKFRNCNLRPNTPIHSKILDQLSDNLDINLQISIILDIGSLAILILRKNTVNISAIVLYKSSSGLCRPCDRLSKMVDGNQNTLDEL
jgi:hypothetical protein